MNTTLCLPPLEWLVMQAHVWAGPEGHYDGPTTDFLVESERRLRQLMGRGSGLLQVLPFGHAVPWLYLLSFTTKSLGRTAAGEIVPLERHAIAVRLLPDILRRANRWEMLRYLAPIEPVPFHPNIAPPPAGAICLEVYPAEGIAEIALSLHDLLRYRLRQTDEHDALNHEACQYTRNHIAAPLDDRPLFGSKLEIQLQRVEASP